MNIRVSHNFRINISFILLATMLSACASHTKLIHDSQYKISQNDFRAGDPENALRDFPKKEDNGFITTSEKAWLQLWTDNQDIIDLEKISNTLDDRKQISVSRETQHFFLSQTEDGYIPGEHEIIVLHLISAMQFLKVKKWTEAEVEARRAAFYLQSYFPEDKEHFDDPALRIWLAGIWTALGLWSEAVVDLRKAKMLNPSLALDKWISSPTPPPDFSLTFNGAGPDVKWNNDSTPFISNPTPEPKDEAHSDTAIWYDRHLQRNTQIRELIEKSNYFSESLAISASTNAKKTSGFVASSAIKGIGIVTGAAVVGIGLVAIAHGASGSAVGYIIGGGIFLGTYLWKQGDKTSAEINNWAESDRKEQIEKMQTYRFIRFLPNWISLSATKYKSDLIKSRQLEIQSPNGKNTVHFIQKF